MAGTYDHKINRNTDWGGDASTGGLPVTGRRVQEFIKEELNGKFGSVYLNTGTSEYFCFANKEAEEQYKITHDETLILGRFEAISNYSVYIVDTTQQKSVLNTHKNNVLSFKYKVENNNTHMSTGEPVKIEYTFNNAGTVYSFTEERYPGGEDLSGYTPVSFIMDDYVKDGTNNIVIKITGKNTFATGQIGMTFEMFDLKYTPTFDYNNSWRREEENISVQYTISGAKTKYIEWYIDGEKCKEDTVIVDITGGDTVYLPTSGLSEGVHSFQTRAYVKTASDTKYYTENNFYTFAVVGDVNPCVLVNYVVPDGTLVEDVLKITTSQFEVFNFGWGFYDPSNRRLNVTFTYAGKKISTVSKSNGEDTEKFSYRPVDEGEHNLVIEIADENSVIVFSDIIVIDVKKSDTALSEAKSGMILKLSAMNRNNDEEDRTEENPDGTRNVWEYTTEGGVKYSTTFNGFAWNSQQGWYNNALVCSDGAYIDIDIKPMASDWAKNGGTIEVDVETFDVEDENATVCVCSDNTADAAYVKITATQAKIKAYGEGKALETRFRDNDRMHLCFIGNAAGKLEDSNLLYIVNNGVLERATNFNDGDQVVSQSTLRIGDIDGNGKVKCRIRSIRVYNRALSVDEAFGNYVIDSDDVQKKYEENDIYKEGSNTEVDYNKIVQKIPVLIFTGSKFPMINKGADKTPYFFDVEYTNMQDPTRNFTAFHVQTKLQGTSSLGYPRKNYKIKTKNGKQGQTEFDATNLMFDPDTRRLYNKETGIEIDYENVLTTCWTFNHLGAVQKNGNLKVKNAETKKVNDWTLKADYMESSCSHNTGAAKMWNAIFKNVKLANTNTYKDKANEWAQGKSTAIRKEVEGEIATQKDYVCRTQAQKVAEAYGTGEVRTALDGFPIVCFYRLSHDSDLVFMGQYNFNNDKSSEELFGFQDIFKEDQEETENNKIFDGKEVECWEGLSNTNPIGLFKDNSLFYSEWQKTYESRYPEQDGGTYTLTNLKELNDWVISTRHVSGETVYGTTITIDPSFAEKINDYKYGYVLDLSGHVSDSFVYSAGTGVVEDNAANRQKKFEVEKWEHFDVWKLAGYYIFLMRYGAVDQFVKNTMLTTEGIGKFGGKYKKWYFINYDNDCLFGLRNNGVLAFGYDLNRQTVDPDWDPGQYESGYSPDVVYAMMGHDSTLWNNLEADEEFMRMVRALDDAMHAVDGTAALNYEGFCQIFDKEQTDCWCERIYNSNERYKYIYPFKGIGDASGQSTNNLWMLQGTRKAHRHWWLANRLEYYDAMWISGEYKNSFLEMKANVSEGTYFDIVAGADFYYAWGNNKTLIESNVKLKPGESRRFISPTPQVQGDPIRIYAITKIRELDLSDYMAGITQLNFTGITTETTNELRKLIIGNENRSNTALSNIDSISNMNNVEYLDITNCSGIKTFNAGALSKLKVLKAKGTSLQAFAPMDGAKLSDVTLPSTIQTLNLTNIAFENGLTDLKYSVSTSLHSLTLKNKNKIKNDYYNKLIRPWLDLIKTAATKDIIYSYANMNVTDIDWTSNDIEDLYAFEEFSHSANTMNLAGKIDLRGYGSLTRTELNRLKDIFGEDCFNKYNSLYILCPTSIFIESDADEMVAGKNNIFYSTIYPARPAGASVTYTISAGTRTGVNLIQTYSGTSEIGILQSQEIVTGKDDEFTLVAELIVPGSSIIRKSNMTFKVLDPTYPSTVTIEGENSMYTSVEQYTYDLTLLTNKGKEPIGTYAIEWTLSGDTEALSYINLQTSGPSADKRKYIIKTNNGTEPTISATLWLKVKVTSHDGTIKENEFRVLVLNHDVIMTDISNPVVMAKCYEAGWATLPTAMMRSEVEAVTNLGTTFANINTEFSFNELAYFTRISDIKSGAFANSKVTKITIPANVTEIQSYAFSGCTKLANIQLNCNLDYIAEGCFMGCNVLNSFVAPSNCVEIRSYAFGGTNIKQMVLQDAIDKTNAIVIPDGLLRIQDDVFEYSTGWSTTSTSNKLTLVCFPKSLKQFGKGSILRGKNIAEFYVDEENEDFASYGGVLYDKNTDTLFKYPAKMEGETYEEMMNVVEISDYAFYGVQYLKNFTMPNGTVTIGDYCFAESNIEHFNLSQNSLINTLPMGLFYGCGNLMDITFNTVYAPLKTICELCFDGCVSLTEMNIPEGVTKIKSQAFGSCVNVTALTFPDTVVEMEGFKTGTTFGSLYGPIYKCNSLEEVTLPPYMRTMYNRNVINACGNLRTLNLAIFSYDRNVYYVYDANEQLVGTYYTEEEALANKPEGGSIVVEVESVVVNGSISDAFINACPIFEAYVLNPLDNKKNFNTHDGAIYQGNTIIKVPAAKTTIEFLPTVTALGGNSFEGVQITNIVVPDSVVSIGANVFMSAGLKNCTLGRGVNGIPMMAFFSCGAMEKLICRAETLGSIGNNAFYGNGSLRELTILSTTVPYLGTNSGIRSNGVLKVSYGMTDAFSANTQWQNVFFNNGWTIEEKMLNDTIYVKVSGTTTIDPSNGPYLVSERENAVASDGVTEQGEYIFRLGGTIANNEKVYFRETREGENKASFNPWMGVDKYEISYTPVTFAQPKFMSAAKEEKTETVSRIEYDRLLAKVNQMSSILNDFLK